MIRVTGIFLFFHFGQFCPFFGQFGFSLLSLITNPKYPILTEPYHLQSPLLSIFPLL